MSVEQQTFPPPPCSFSSADLGGFSAVAPQVSPPPEMETLRIFVNDRLTAVVEDIMEVFGKTMSRYREQIELQRRQLDSMRAEESRWKPAEDPLPVPSWIKPCPDEQILSVQLDHTNNTEEINTGTSAAQIKTEAEGEDFVNGDFDPAVGSEGMSEVRLLTDCSETEDSGEYWRDPSEFWKTEEENEAEGQSSSSNSRLQSSSDQQLDPGLSRQPAGAFICKVCGESYQRIGHLFTHASAHLKDCSLCGKHLDQTENLKFHLRVHRKSSFSCSVCGQSFTLRGNLRIHMMIHSGERPYPCNVCGKSFGRRASLVRHVRSHTGEKPYICKYCGHGFVEKGNLTVHLRTHTGERPYWCSNCDRRFSQMSSYHKHPCQRRGLTSDCTKT
ncbi:zinc finger and SCAN domain-containing protein 2-like [Cheilinus undulatus]|uniref:zinc finger and SCAN domain-containing protein 2-like n=1 Tax=Cheilinus undulatus TaxID=241271 RepID=UPI001BD6AAF9|nr:zinc finger and SCAN domain-containing protein 2-like [Cheilinus undulatus]